MVEKAPSPIEHDLHKKRFGRNIAMLGVLLFLVFLIIGVTVVKMRSIGPIEGHDHVLRPALIEPQSPLGAPQ